MNENSLPLAIEHKDEIFRRLRVKTPAIFLDYDGTLTPIVEYPWDAKLTEDTRQIIRGLAAKYPVAVISGRDLENVRQMVNVAGVAYAGSHGFDILNSSGKHWEQVEGKRFLPYLDKAETELTEAVKGIKGARVERKRFAIAAHYRQVDRARVKELEKVFDVVLSHFTELRKTTGKEVFELRPNISWDKGKAILSLLDTLYKDGAGIIPIYIGDDDTDEDAFRAISGNGIGIIVGLEARETAAQYRLRDTGETAQFLRELGREG